MVDLSFTPFSPEFAADPYPVFDHLRRQAPVFWWEAGMGWMLTRYDDVVAGFADRRLSNDFTAWKHAARFLGSAENLPALQLFREANQHGVFQLSEADHRRVRRVIAPTFSPKGVERMRGRVVQIVDEFMATLDRAEEFDVVRELAEPLPFRIFCEVLGIPTALRTLFQGFADASISVATSLYLPPAELERLLAPYPAGLAAIRQLIDERRQDPTDDLLSNLVRAEQEGQRLSTEELVGLVSALVIAGFETSTYMLQFLVLELLRHPDQLALVRADPTLIPNAVEEVLRHQSIAKSGLARFALADLTIRDTSIAKGDMVYLVLPAALRDADVFERPDEFDVRRDQSKAINFGHGPHTCVGNWLAKLEGQVALEALLSRFDRMTIVEEPRYAPHAMMRKMSAFKVRVSPTGSDRERLR